MNIIQNLELVNCFHQSMTDQLEKELLAQGFEIILFDGAKAIDKASFLAQITHCFPMDETCQPTTWDGFIDCLWRGLNSLESERVAFIWQSAQALLENDLQTFVTITRLLSDVSRSVATTEHGFSHEMWFTTLLLGESDLFPVVSIQAANVSKKS